MALGNHKSLKSIACSPLIFWSEILLNFPAVPRHAPPCSSPPFFLVGDPPEFSSRASPCSLCSPFLFQNIPHVSGFYTVALRYSLSKAYDSLFKRYIVSKTWAHLDASRKINLHYWESTVHILFGIIVSLWRQLTPTTKKTRKAGG